MISFSIPILSAALLFQAAAAQSQGRPDLETERRVVEYLKQNVKPGQRVIVSDLYNEVFKSPDERRVLERLFNTFFKIPLFVAQYYASTREIPTLADISRQFNLPIDGEAAVLLTIIDSDPRVPKFIKRDPASGEIISVDVEAVSKDRRFGQILERTLMGWAGKTAPPFSMTLLNGETLSSSDLTGKSYLVYFWFSGCPPCVRIAPHLAALQKKYAPQNFTVVAVNADRFLELETADSERSAYVKKSGFTFPVGHLNRKMQEDYGNVNVYPTLFLVDSKGLIHKHYVNYQTLQALSSDVEDVLKRKGTVSGRR